METYKNIDEFIQTVFPFEYNKIITRKKSEIRTIIDGGDKAFNEELEKILNGEAEEKEEPKEIEEEAKADKEEKAEKEEKKRKKK